MPHLLRSACAAVLTALLALSGLVLGSGAALAAPGPAAATSTTLAGSLTAAGVLGVDLGVGPNAAVSTTGAQLTDDDTAPSVAVGLDVLEFVALDVGALSASATANATETGTSLPPGSATAQTTVSAIDLLGVVGVETVTSDCAITPSASSGTTTVVGLTIGGEALTIAPGASVSLSVGLATVTASLDETTRTNAGGQLTVSPGVLRLAVTGSLLGLTDVSASLTVAATSCTAPTPASAITSLTPVAGPEAGGQTVTITGSGFSGATGVTFDGIPATGVTVVDDATLTAVTPPHTAGVVDVTVGDPEGNGTLPAGYTYLAVALNATTITPGEGPDSGGTPVTLTGTGLLGVTDVSFGDVPATGVTVVSDTELTAISPAGPAGTTVDVTVAEPGQPASVLTDAFTYLATPVVAIAADPATGPDSGGTTVTVTGSGFTGATGVTFDGVPGTGFVIVSDGEITVLSPAGPVGTVPLAVIDGDRTLVPGGFTYVGTQVTATAVAPGAGPDSGGTPVTVTGTGFTGATGVTFDGVPGTDFVVVDDTTVAVTTPAGAAGPADVVVTDPAGNGAPLSFTYEASPAVVDALSPSEGPVTGGTQVTVTGSGFTGTTTVTVGGTPVRFTVVDDRTLTFTTPPGTSGEAAVVLGDAGGDGSATFTYTVVPAGDRSGSSDALDSLARTGAPVTGLIGTAVLLVLVGALLTGMSRFRRPTGSTARGA